MPYNDDEYRKAYGAAWRKKHPEYAKEYNKKYYRQKATEIKVKTLGITEEELEKLKAEKARKKELKLAQKAFTNKMNQLKLDIISLNGNLIISSNYRAKTKIAEEYEHEYNKHEYSLLLWLRQKITNKFIFISETSRQGVTAKREIYIKDDYEFLLSLSDEVWHALTDWNFMKY